VEKYENGKWQKEKSFCGKVMVGRKIYYLIAQI
jgi:hypothetical protein